MKFKKKELVYILFMVVIVFGLSLIIPLVEFGKITQINKQIEEVSKQIEFLENIGKKDEFIQILFTIQYTSGLNLEAEREKIQQDLVGHYSLSVYNMLQYSVVYICENLNQASEYTNVKVDCLKVDSIGEPTNQTELEKINLARIHLGDAEASLKDKKIQLEFKEDFWVRVRNMLYFFLIILSGLGAAFKYYLDKRVSPEGLGSET